LTPFLEASRPAPIHSNSGGFDSRGIAIDAHERAACEDACAPGDDACLLQCASVPFQVYVGNRAPPSLVLGQSVADLPNPGGGAPTPATGLPSDDLPAFNGGSVPLTAGTSRVVVGNVLDPHGNPVQRVFVVCFDTRTIFVYDPAARRIEKTIHTGRGPQAIAIDTAVSPDPSQKELGHAFGYVAHFTDSYLGVVDLNQAHSTYGQIIMTVGQPTAPRAQK
jgi:hypothetical protein